MTDIPRPAPGDTDWIDWADDEEATSDAFRDGVSATELSATGTPSATTFLRGDNTWAASAETTVTGLSASTSAGAANALLVQAAINAAGTAAGGRVVIPIGDWTINPIQLRSRVELCGLGFGSILRLSNGANAHMVTLFDGETEQIGICDIRLEGNKANQTVGNLVHLDNTAYVSSSLSATVPDMGDPNHYMRRVLLGNAKGHGVYTAGALSQSQFVSVFAYNCDGNGFRVDSPDNHFIDCVQAQSGLDGFFFTAASNRIVACKSWQAGRLDAASGCGFAANSATSRLDFIGCEAQDNRQHGYALNGGEQHTLSGCRADRNGLGASAAGGAGDGLYMAGVTSSRIELTAGDRNSPPTIMQARAYNCGSGNDGNVVTIVGGLYKTEFGVGSFGPNSVVTLIDNGLKVAVSASPWPATTQAGTTYTFAAADTGTVVESNNAAAVTFTVPPNSSVAFPIGTILEVHQLGAGQVTLAPGVGVTLRSRGARLRSAGQYGVITLRKRATNEWVVGGDVVV